MQLWIDNTGLQSTGTCTEGKAVHNYDVDGLLQLATLVIFGNKVSLNGFEAYSIAKRSEEIVCRLQRIGISENILSINKLTKSEYQLACLNAANSIASALYDGFNPVEYTLRRELYAITPQERVLGYMALANEREGSSKLQEIEDSALTLTDKAPGAVEYMMACSPALRAAVARILINYPIYATRNIYLLDAYIRYYLNNELAGESIPKLSYAPSVARARLVVDQNQYIERNIEDKCLQILDDPSIHEIILTGIQELLNNYRLAPVGSCSRRY